MKSRTEYRTMEMNIPLRAGDNSRAAFEAVARLHGAGVTNLKVVESVGAKSGGAVVLVSFTKRVRLSKCERMDK